MGPNLFRLVSVLGRGSSQVGGRVQFSSLLLRANQISTRFWWKFLVDSLRWRLFSYSILYGIHSLIIIIGHGIDDSYLGLGITSSQPF